MSRRILKPRAILPALLSVGMLAGGLALASAAPGATRHDRLTRAHRSAVAASPATPYLDAVARTLQERSPGTKGKVWWVSDRNRLPAGWLLQTPDCWGQSKCGEPPAGGRRIVERMREMVASARKSVDISELYDFTLA